MGPKKSNASSTATPDNSYEAAEAQLWKALKGGDICDLERCLFLTTNAHPSDDDTSTFTPVLSVHPFAKRLVASQNAKKLTPLNYVIDTGLEPAHIDLMLEAGADINAKDGSKQGSTPLHAACWGQEDVLLDHLLLRGADPSIANNDGSTIFHIVVKSSSGGVLEYLLEMEDPDRIANIKTIGRTNSTSKKTTAQQRDVLAILQMKDGLGIAPLHYAIGEIAGGNGATEVAQHLLTYLEMRVANSKACGDAGAVVRNTVTSIVNMRTTAGFTPLHMAAVSGVDTAVLASLVGRLIALGADAGALIDVSSLSLEDIDDEDDEEEETEKKGSSNVTSYTALMALVAQSKAGLCVREALRSLSTTSAASSGAVISESEEEGKEQQRYPTILHVALRHRKLKLLRDILLANADGKKLCVPPTMLSDSQKQSLRTLLAQQLVLEGIDVLCEEVAKRFVELEYLTKEQVDAARAVAGDALAARGAQENADQSVDGEGEERDDEERGDYSGHGSKTLPGTRTNTNNNASNKQKEGEGVSKEVNIHKKAPAPQQMKLGWGAKLLLASFMLSFFMPILDWLFPK